MAINVGTERKSLHSSEDGELANFATPNVDSRSLTESHKKHSKGSRENPLDAPGLLLQAVDSPLTEQLEETLGLIKQLPPEFLASLPNYMDTALIDDLGRIARAMRKLRDNVVPYKEELLVLAGPDETLEPLSRKFGNAAACESITAELSNFVETRIAEPLLKAASQLRWRGGNYGVVEWAEETSDAVEPEPIADEFLP